VPTWNYAVVHAYGRVRTIEDPQWLHALVERLTGAHEAGRTEPWHVDDAPDDHVARMLRGIVGFHIAIDRIEGKWKMSQNHAAANRHGVVAGLQATGAARNRAVAEYLQETGTLSRDER
jgi:transcriptional regulator